LRWSGRHLANMLKSLIGPNACLACLCQICLLKTMECRSVASTFEVVLGWFAETDPVLDSLVKKSIKEDLHYCYDDNTRQFCKNLEIHAFWRTDEDLYSILLVSKKEDFE
jgi:hypothetical protein